MTNPPAPASPISHDLTTLPITVPPSAAASVGLSVAYLAGLSVAWPLLVHRVYVKKKPIVGGREKRGHLPAQLKRSSRDRARIWIHAVSVGEVNAAKPLLKQLKAAGHEVILSTTTATGREVAQKAASHDDCFFYPYDLSWMLQRAFEHLQPDLVVLMELEVWPNFMREACHRQVPVVVVNGRITDRSFKRYRKIRGIFGGALRRCTAVLAQDETFAQRFADLGVLPERLRVSGSMKYDAVDTAMTAAERAALRDQMRAALHITPGVPVWVCGSLHPGEEPAIVQAWRAARAAGRNVVPVVVPRHPERFDSMAETFRAEGFVIHRKTALDIGAATDLRMTGETADLILGDTMGELKKIFTAADLAFVGGSFIPHGGQNPAEPVGLGVPCFSGPSMFNFEEITALLTGCGALTQVADGAALGQALIAALDPGDTAAWAARGREGQAALIAEQGATARTVAYLNRLLQSRRK